MLGELLGAEMQIPKKVFFGWSEHPDYNYDDSLAHLFVEREWKCQEHPGIFFGPTINLDDEVVFLHNNVDDTFNIGRFVSLWANYADGDSRKFEEDFRKGTLTGKIKITFRVNGNEYVTFESLLT